MKQFDFVVIGSGISGLNFALNVSKKGKVLIVTKKKIIEAATNYAQGGIAAVLDKLDDYKKHINDTLKAGAFHNNKQAVQYMVKNGPKEIQKLQSIGVPFAEEQGRLKLTKEGGHSRRRVAFVGDRTGHSIEKALIKAVHSNPNIEIWEDTFAIDLLSTSNLLSKSNKCYGVSILKNNRAENIFASAVILATGGLGQVYKHTTNPRISTGDGVAMAARAGAKMQDLEFIQFHPTALNVPRKSKFLLTEALRGEGAKLLNHKGKRFVDELLPRDKVSRAIYKESKKGPVYLDISHKNPKEIQKRFPHIYKELKKRGYDLSREQIPVSPAAHYSCGGVKVNLKGETSVQNLYAFGEVACTGVHGANRLASNSLLEAVVFSEIISENIKKRLQKNPSKFPKPRFAQTSNHQSLKQKIKKIMWEKVGIVRNKSDLDDALYKLEQIQFAPSKNIAALETKNLLESAILITKAAIKRKKSIGCHFISS
ncbi:L-aspartate oxidase [Patescibacteria group bacterium]